MERRPGQSKPSDSQPKKKNVVFFHPDLGIGGAERFIVDAAVGLKNLGHKVTIFTSHRDRNHCFDEARDGTLDVRVRGNVFPATLFGRFKILCSIVRQLLLLVAVTRTGELAKLEPGVFILDQLSAGIPFLRWFWEDIHTLFYCHFPDLLLVQNRKRWYKRVWRVPFDWLESWGIRGADKVVVNSGFTKDVVEDIWPGLGGEDGVGIVYPCVDTRSVGKNLAEGKASQELWKDKKVLLSINRFERKKDVGLAIKAFGGLTQEERVGVRLVIAGGYDLREAENVSYHHELEDLARSLKLKSATAKNMVSAQAIPDDIEILFLLSVPESLKATLLATARLLIYTPSNEHFGIVPLEAGLAGVPVLAANNGGPLETIEDGETGFLKPPEKVDEWTDIIRECTNAKNTQNFHSMGEKGKKRAAEVFSESTMAQRLNDKLDETMKATRPQATELGDVGMAAILYAIFSVVIAVVIGEAFRLQKAGRTPSAWDIKVGSGIIGLALLGGATITWKLMQNESAFT